MEQNKTMSIKGYFEFVKWLFIHTNKDFDKQNEDRYEYYEKHPNAIAFSYKGSGLLSNLSGTGRLVTLIIMWISIIAMTIALVFPIDMKIKYVFLGLIPLSWVTVSLMVCKFSFIYYAILYPLFAFRDRSLNDKVLFYKRILYKECKGVENTIKKYFKCFDGDRKLKYAEYCLFDKTNKKIPEEDLGAILRFTSKAVFFNGEKVFDGRMTDLSQLEECLENIIASGKSVPIQHKR